MDRYLLLLDHENIPYDQFPISRLISTAIQAVGAKSASSIQIRIRAYGGWFEGTVATSARNRALAYFQNNLPAIIKVDSNFVRVSFEFADHLLSETIGLREDTRFPITHTVANRSTPVHFKKKLKFKQCQEHDCEVSAAKRWFNNRKACARRDCKIAFGDAFERSEQKQVDIHLATDLLTSVRAADLAQNICVFTSDWDFIPAITAAAASLPAGMTLTLIRFGPTRTYLDPALCEVLKVRVINLD